MLIYGTLSMKFFMNRDTVVVWGRGERAAEYGASAWGEKCEDPYRYGAASPETRGSGAEVSFRGPCGLRPW